MKDKKIKILIESWTKIPHSYSIVNCFHLIYLYKNFGEKIEFYLIEKEYYNSEWSKLSDLSFLPNEYINIIKNMNYIEKENKNEVLKEIDLIFRLCYPYDISMNENNYNKPICLFYTSEFGKKMDFNNFKLEKEVLNEFYVKTYFQIYSNFYFLTPSKWSSMGMNRFLENKEEYKNKIINHGVDTKLFYKIKDLYLKECIFEKYKNKYNIQKDDYLIINIGALTNNKGIDLILESLYLMVIKLKNEKTKCILKMMKKMYNTENSIFINLQKIIIKYNNGIFNEDEYNILIQNHLVLIDEVLNFEELNNLFNICDLYLYPFYSEGFGLTALESLTSGLKIMIPNTGSLKEVMEDIKENTNTELIEFIKSEVNEEFTMNKINIENIIYRLNELYIKKNNNILENNNNYDKLIEYINEKYSWNSVSNELYKYFEFILNDFSEK